MPQYDKYDKEGKGGEKSVHDWQSVATTRAASTRAKADWESRNRNLYGDEKGESGAVVSKEISKKSADMARVTAERAGAYKKTKKE